MMMYDTDNAYKYTGMYVPPGSRSISISIASSIEASSVVVVLLFRFFSRSFVCLLFLNLKSLPGQPLPVGVSHPSRR